MGGLVIYQYKKFITAYQYIALYVLSNCAYHALFLFRTAYSLKLC